ncbi:MAG: glycosyltransferase [Reyranella sp.]|uniref:glycosyltransferase n=1 Tax=Reyranella sp. TaxID=1929291 RepID=UPI00122ADCCA|nr:glycosyltransferase [Reyranella sp.]TAJ40483.1 MAG: glycosyltransferase [Reyranella sp.]
MSLRVVHCVGFYFPDPVGGTEVYVRDLANALREHRVECSIAASTTGPGREYAWEGIPVLRYPADSSAEQFQQLVRRLAPDVFHLHSWTTGSGLDHLRQAAALGIPTVATLHVPSPLCLRGTMLLEGKAPCDGRIDEQRCACCWALDRGVPAPAARLISHLPRWTPPPWLARSPARRLATLASARTMAAGQAARLQELGRLCERIVVPSDWVRSALRENAIPDGKILLSRQAASTAFSDGAGRARRDAGEHPLTIGFVGRLETYKGVQTLLEAMGQIPSHTSLRLIIAGISDDPEILRPIEQAAAADPRIELIGPLPHERIPAFLESLDILAVPSRWMETGPIVVLEAQAMGVPVMGADLGGIAERIRDGIDGWLLPFDDPRAWAVAMQQAAADPGEVAARAANSVRSRSVGDVAAEMAALYGEIHGHST